MPESRIDDLNSEQLRAATAGDGPVLTIAGAGTGKTKTLAARMSGGRRLFIDCIEMLSACDLRQRTPPPK